MALSHINDVSLFDETRGWRVLHDGTDDPGSAVDIVTVPTRRQGVIDAGMQRRHEGQPFAVHFQVRGTDQAATEASSETLRALLRSPNITGRRFAVEDQKAALLLHSLVPTERVTCSLHRVRAVLSIPGVFFRDPDAETTSIAAGVTSQTALAGSAPVTDAVVRFPAGAPAVKSLVDVTTGTGIGLDYTGSGYVYVDTASMEAWLTAGASSWTPTGTDLSAYVDYPPAGPLQLWPTFNGSSTAVTVESSHAIAVRARRAWL